MKIQKIVSNVLESNVFLVEQGKDVVIIDAGAEVEKIRQMVGDKAVKGILLTHGHYDHALFAFDYAKAFGCKVYGSEYCKATLADGDANCSEGHFVVNDFSNFVSLKDGELVELGNVKAKCIYTKGHSECSVCYLIDKHLFGGDTLFQRGAGRTDLASGDRDELYESLTILDGVDFETLYSGHGEESSRDEQTKNIYIFKRFLRR